jgi:vitamin B12 transporter
MGERAVAGSGGLCETTPLPAFLLGLRRAALSIALLASPAMAQFPSEVRGRVVDAGSGTAIAGAVIEADGGPRALSAADGSFRLRGLLPGRREVRVRAFGYREWRDEVEARNGAVAVIEPALHPAPVELGAVLARGEASGGAGATVIGRREIAESSARDLGELVGAQPGIVTVRRGGPGAPATLSIRGSGADGVLVLLDGVPLNSLLTGEADVSTVPLEAIERVTLLRGARSARYGARAMAGVVAVETRRASDGELVARAGGGAWGERSAALTLGDRAELGGLTFGGLAGGEWRENAGDFSYAVPAVRGGGRSRRENADARAVSGFLVATAERGASGLLRLRADALRMERGMPGSVVQPSRSARQRVRRDGLGLGARWGDDRFDVRTHLDVQEQSASFRDADPPFGASYDETVHVRALGGSLAAALPVGSWELTSGLEARLLRFGSSMLAPDAPDQQRLAAAWAQGTRTLPLPDGWEVDVHPALRLDGSSLLDGPILSPRMAASVGRGGWSVRAAVGSGFSPPSLADQFFHEGVMARPNPALAPERVRRELELGIEARGLSASGLSFDAELAAFRADVDGMILWFPDHRFVWQPDNFDARRRGGELSLAVRRPGTSFRAAAAVAYAAVRYAAPPLSGQIRYRPEWTGNASLSGALRGARLEISGRYVGERRTVPGSELNRLPAFALVDFRLSRSISWGGRDAELTAGVENLFGMDAAMLVDYPYPGRTWRLGGRLRIRDRAPSPDADPLTHGEKR